MPPELADAAGIRDIPLARYWGDEIPRHADARRALFDAQTSAQVERAETFDVLALSGGGPDGAFGAGLLKGWTESGTRPQFRVVTGISTGALIAPLAFVGPERDSDLERIYTQTPESDLIRDRGILGLLSDSIADSSPLRAQISRYIDDEMVRAIAAEYRKGRRLFIGTTHLDAGRQIVWNIGAIADSGIADARELIGDILLASASIPGLFPPVQIDVEVDGQTYDELHVDGGVGAQVIFLPMGLDVEAFVDSIGIQGRRRIFVIRNSKVDPEWSVVERKLGPIAKASIRMLIDSQGDGDLFRLYLQALQNEFEYRVAYIPPDFDVERQSWFDPDYMSALFDLGYELAREGYPWAERPPGALAD
ncbi:MAG: patatin-like phospholipase family protein [Candidatus Binatia bacterium]